MLEEIKSNQADQSRKLTELSKLKQTPPAEPLMPQAPSEPQIHKHTHRLELKTSWWIGITAGLLLLVVSSTILNYNLWQYSKQFKDNDLKYRYIKMKGEISNVDLLKLDTLHTKELLQLRTDVETYERLIQEQAEITVRTHTIQQQTKQLKER